MKYKKQECRDNRKQKQRIAQKPVTEPFAGGSLEIFPDRHSPDAAKATVQQFRNCFSCPGGKS